MDFDKQIDWLMENVDWVKIHTAFEKMQIGWQVLDWYNPDGEWVIPSTHIIKAKVLELALYMRRSGGTETHFPPLRLSMDSNGLLTLECVVYARRVHVHDSHWAKDWMK